MKKIIATLLIIFIITLNAPLEANAHWDDLDFYKAFEKHGSVMIITDAQSGNILHANQAASSLHGFLKPKPCREMLYDYNHRIKCKNKVEYRFCGVYL